ncbi:hypothetical protein IBT49_20860 [Erwinia sp. S63]|uniref:Uncharacterized protein n=1 Tax=Candidatus Pantoea communis TaxID=2608354 RepID=A0ABX0S2U7_9GAMM|nr:MULTISPECIES: hypothetical protein [Enterobacterales]MDF7630404.1 hypothetical protein [Erwiniaceae bacterium L1_55_4]KGT86067.1 hypothetical protein NH00_26165 [Enterobacter cancerogenus]MBK0098444.1 hypothetical protein [Erwinia sp. S63]MXP57548.1 hypothetical protein [Pantoea sp. Taur]NIG22270.1 hypothetical protein [Pantoea communis]
MNSKRLTLLLSQPVSRVMLDDIRAIVPPQALNVFINGLDEERYATLDCIQSEENCALLASAIVVWRQLGHVHRIRYQKGEHLREVDDASQFQLFSMMKTHRAIVQLA